jgi:glycosyltransferase involved in cell wall biosynthesis
MLMLPQRSPGVIPYIGIFPVESGPLCQSWANVLASMDKPLVISKFGLEQMQNAGVNGAYLPVGLDTESWRRPTRKERKKLRESMGFTEDQLVVLTVADNQERKNLSAAMDIIAGTAEKGIDVQWMLVTRVNSPVGWKLDDMAIQKGIMDRFMKFERGLPHDRLWTLYSIADAFLLSSKAEGLCMPIIEAMAVGTPVVATDCTAVPEHVFENPEAREGRRGFVMDVAFLHQDPWGNSYRSYVDAESGVEKLEELYEMMRAGEIEEKIIIPARAYAESRTWDRCGDVLNEQIEMVLRKQVIPPTPAMAGRMPPTVPQVIPIAEEDLDE